MYFFQGLSDIGLNYDVGQQFWIEGLAYPKLRTSSGVTGAVICAGSSTVAILGRVGISASVIAAGSATASFTPHLYISATMTVAASSTVAIAGRVGISAHFAAASAPTAAFGGQVGIVGAFSCAPASVVTFQASLTISGSVSVTGTCSISQIGADAINVTFDADGESTAAFDSVHVSGSGTRKYYFQGLGMVPGLGLDGSQTYWDQGLPIKQIEGDGTVTDGTWIWKGIGSCSFSSIAEVLASFRCDGRGTFVVSGTIVSIVSGTFQCDGRAGKVQFLTKMGAVKITCLTGDGVEPDSIVATAFGTRRPSAAY